jgi:hypothetical protein
MSEQPQATPVQDNPSNETVESPQVPVSPGNSQIQYLVPSLTPEQSIWDKSVTIMATLGVIGIVVFLVYVLSMFSRVNQWSTVTDSFANDMLQVRISFPQNVGRDETNKLHVVVENIGQETFSNLRVGFTSNGIARFKASEALFSELPANAQRNATLEYTIDNASVIRDSEIQLTAHLYYMTATLPITGTALSTTVQLLQPVAFNQPISISVNPDREYYLETQEVLNNASAKLPALIIGIISAIGALVSINVQGGPAKIVQWLVRAPVTNNVNGGNEP